jgi:hypothetical protein
MFPFTDGADARSIDLELLPVFDGYPYLVSRIGHTPLRHIALVPGDWPRERIVALARAQASANRFGTVACFAFDDVVYVTPEGSTYPSDILPAGLPVIDRLRLAEEFPVTPELTTRHALLEAFSEQHRGDGYLIGDGLEARRPAIYPRQAAGTGGRWHLTEDQVAAVLGYFNSIRPGPATTASGVLVAVDSDVPSDWFWEGRIQDVMVDYLRHDRWVIVATANTASRARGDDIEAVKNDREVKGYPSVGYRDPRRAGEVKRTNPTLQAKHWYAEALLKVVRIKGTRGRTEVAMALPDAPRYRSLLSETNGALKQLGVGVYLVRADGDVEVLLPHEGLAK